MNIKHTAIGALQRLARRTSEHLILNIGDDLSEDKKELTRIMSSALDSLDTAAGPVNPPDWTEVRALRHAPKVFGASAPTSLAPLQQAALSAFGYVNWAEFYVENNWSRPFLSEFANGEGVGPNGVLKSQDLILGLFLLGPNSYYPPHAHPAEEFYVVLSGDVFFHGSNGASPIRKIQGDFMIFRSNEAHAIQTFDTPVFAVHGQVGAINEPSWYRDDMNDFSEPKKYPELKKGIVDAEAAVQHPA